MENGILFATSDGFYYEGVPSKGSYTTSTSSTNAYGNQNVEKIFRQIGAGIIVVQIVIVTLAVICIVKALLNSINNKKIEDSENDLSGESADGKKVQKKATIPYYVFSIILLLGNGLVNIIKDFWEAILK